MISSIDGLAADTFSSDEELDESLAFTRAEVSARSILIFVQPVVLDADVASQTDPPGHQWASSQVVREACRPKRGCLGGRGRSRRTPRIDSALRLPDQLPHGLVAGKACRTSAARVGEEGSTCCH